MSNHELVVLIEDEFDIVEQAQLYFDDLFSKIQSHGDAGIITMDWIDEEKKLVADLATNQTEKSITYSNTMRRGVELSKINRPDFVEAALRERTNAQAIEPYWLKFEGTGSDRVPNSITYTEMKGRKNRDLTLTYFPRRPSGITNHDILFLTIISYDEFDQPTPLIIGYASTPGYSSSNQVTEAEIAQHTWKGRFQYYVELSDGKVIDSPIKNGIRLIDLYAALGKDTFPTLSKREHISQRKLHSMHFRRSHIRITAEAGKWLTTELEKRFNQYGFDSLKR